MVKGMTIRLADEVKERLELEAFQTKTPQNQIIERLLRDRYELLERLEEHGATSPPDGGIVAGSGSPDNRK